MISYRHIRRERFDSQDTPEHTIAAEIRDGAYHIGIATCSPRDMYCKATGRDIARSRLYTDTHIITLDDLLSMTTPPDDSIFTFAAHARMIDSIAIEDFSIHYVLSYAEIRFIQNQRG